MKCKSCGKELLSPFPHGFSAGQFSGDALFLHEIIASLPDRPYKCSKCKAIVCGMCAASKAHAVKSSTNLCPLCGGRTIAYENESKEKSISGVEFIDLRSDEEIEIEAETQNRLSKKEEKVAQHILELLDLTDDINVGRKIRKEIRKLGEKAYKQGGDELMLRIAYRVKALGGSLRELEYLWDGIGDLSCTPKTGQVVKVEKT